MAELYHTEEEPQLICWDRKNYGYFEDQLQALKNSRTVYVGNLSFFTNEQQIYETFSTVGNVQRLIMGLNNITKTPCGFCFVEYYNQDHCHAALKFISETTCDERLIRSDADGGFLPGRQFGRGKSGGQIRDERKTDYDPARGRFIPPSVLGKHSRDDRERDRGRDRDNYRNRDSYQGNRDNYRRDSYRRDDDRDRRNSYNQNSYHRGSGTSNRGDHREIYKYDEKDHSHNFTVPVRKLNTFQKGRVVKRTYDSEKADTIELLQQGLTSARK